MQLTVNTRDGMVMGTATVCQTVTEAEKGGKRGGGGGEKKRKTTVGNTSLLMLFFARCQKAERIG